MHLFVISLYLPIAALTLYGAVMIAAIYWLMSRRSF